jgi:hypothetical protein
MSKIVPAEPVKEPKLGNKVKLQKVKIPKEEPIAETISSFLPAEKTSMGNAERDYYNFIQLKAKLGRTLTKNEKEFLQLMSLRKQMQSEGYYKNIDIDRQRDRVAGEEEPVGDFRVVRNKDGQWVDIKQHHSSNMAFKHAQNIKQKYPSMEVGVRWPNGKINLVGLSVKEEAAGVGVVKGGKDPRYVMATTGDQNAVTGKTPMKNLRAFNLAEEDLAWVRNRLGEGAVDALAARHIEYIGQDIAELKNRITTEKLPANYVEALKQKIAKLEAERSKLAFTPG